jgi:hypothetical protein
METREPTVTLPDHAELGPAMRALPTERMRLFVVAMHEHAAAGHGSQLRAAEAAGYSGNKANLAHQGHMLAHDERIQKAILEEGQRRMGAFLPLATSIVGQLLLGGKDTIKLRAAAMIMDRTGIIAKTEHKVTVTHQLTEDETVARIMYLAKSMNMDPKLLLGQAGVSPNAETPSTVMQAALEPIDDAEFEEDFS